MAKNVNSLISFLKVQVPNTQENENIFHLIDEIGQCLIVENRLRCLKI